MDDESRDAGSTSSSAIGRRGLLGLAGTGALGAAAGAGALIGRAGEPSSASPTGVSDRAIDNRLRASGAVVTDHDPLPQGLSDRTPAFGHLLAIDLARSTSPREAQNTARQLLMRLGAVVDDAARGRRAGPGADASALGTRSASLQVTVGVGASLLARCDLPRPEGLVDLPHYPTDRLRGDLSGGDLLVQVGAEDPMRLAGAVQRVISALRPYAVPRWSRAGFRPTEAASEHPHHTTRNLMGHLDGTANSPRDSPLWRTTVTTRDPGSWMDGGSYLVVRLIRMDLERWFTRDVAARDDVIGRDTFTGAPLGGRHETDPVDLEKRGRDGEPLIGPHAHIRLAGTRNTAGARIYRRSWNYDSGWTPDGERDAGLIFLAWQSDPRRGFMPIQESLTRGADALSTYTAHIGSAVFAVPPRGDDHYPAQRLLEG